MIHYFLIIFAFILLLAIFGICIIIGRNMGVKHLSSQPQSKLDIVGVAESAVFGLLALLIAFTFSGAYERFESRKLHLVEEANIFEKAYNYIDLVPQNMQRTLREDVRQYFECYINIFSYIPYSPKIEAELRKAQVLEDKIWDATITATDESTNKTLAQVYVPAMNEMFESAHTGYYMTRVHPPMIIFALLIGLAALGAFLVGYNSAESKRKYPIHSLCYVFLTAFTIYVIINMEYPRVGFISMGTFDKILVEVKNNMI